MIERILTDVGGTFTDLSYELNQYYTQPEPIALDTTDYIYLGSRFPFNSKYFKLDVANVNTADMVIEYWDGNQFREVVEVRSETTQSGIPLARSGSITWTPNKNYRWAREDTVNIAELSNIVIYGIFWLRISFSASISTDITWIGNLNTTTAELGTEYPDLVRTNFMNAFKAGKTDWEEQIVRASRLVVDDLIRRRVIDSSHQILDKDRLNPATISKTAEIIYAALGDDYADQVARARNDYKDRLHQGLFTVDLNSDAIEQVNEGRVRQGRLHR